MRAYLCGKKINAARCARKVIGNPELNRCMDKTRRPRAGHQSHELKRRIRSCHWRLSLGGPLYRQIAVALAAVPKMPAMCHKGSCSAQTAKLNGVRQALKPTSRKIACREASDNTARNFC